MVSGDGERGGKVPAGKGQLRARCRMVYDRAAMQPRLKLGRAFSNVEQQPRKLRIRLRADEGSIGWERREYAGRTDLEGVFMVIAATNDTDVNIRIYDDAERRAMLVNVVDVPPLCNFILPAIVRSGPLAIAISTAGASPALAKRIKGEIAEEYGEPYARLAVLLNEARGWAKRTLPTYQDRKDFFEGIVNGDPDPIALLREGDEEAVRLVIERAKQARTAAAA